METILVRINDKKAYSLLKDLEKLEVITVLKKRIKKSSPKLSKKYAGKLPDDIADNLQEYVTQGRKQWSNDSI